MVMITELKFIQMEFREWLSGKGTGNHKTYKKKKKIRGPSYNFLSPLLDFTVSSRWR